MKDIATTLRDAAKQLEASSSSARLDAEVLLAEVLGKQRSYLLAFSEELLSTEQAQQFSTLMALRIKGRPIAHILGRREFWSLDLKVTADTLIPRPDTETLVETALSLRLPANACVLDLGTGSGAIALALAKERPAWSLVAVDISAAALAVAKENSVQLQINNVAFFQGDWFAALPTATSGSLPNTASLDFSFPQQAFDLIVSNPPYLSNDDPHLSQGDVRFEPRSALVAKAEGLADYLKIVEQAGQYLLPAAWLVFEHGYEQAQQVRQVLQDKQFINIGTQQDLSGNDRVTMGQKP